MLYKNTKIMVCSPVEDTHFSNIVTGVLQGDTLAPYLFYILFRLHTMNINRFNKRKWFHIKKKKKGKNLTISCKNRCRLHNLMLLTNTPAQAEYLLHSRDQIAGCIGFYLNTNKTEFMCFKLKRAISILNSKHRKLEDLFTYSNLSSSKSYVNIHLAKAGNAIDRLSIIQKSD